MKKAVDLIFPEKLIKEPVIHEMSRKFDVTFNLRRAKVTEAVGEMVLVLEGSEKALNDATEWLKQKGIKVELTSHDTLES